MTTKLTEEVLLEYGFEEKIADNWEKDGISLLKLSDNNGFIFSTDIDVFLIPTLERLQMLFEGITGRKLEKK